jgi:hypothetical protein
MRAFDLSQKHVDVPKELQTDPWREYKMVKGLLAVTQKEHDEKRAINGLWWAPYHIGREPWHSYDTKKAWFWGAAPKKIAKK